MITTAQDQHINDLHALWTEAFGGSAHYVNMFLSKRANLSDTVVYLHEDRVWGMLFILPCHLVFEGTSYPCAYLYGVATAKEQRGQGISSKLLHYAHELCAQRGYSVCALVPADKPLFDFYAKRGYSTQGYLKTLTVTADSLKGSYSPVVLSDISSGEIFTLRKEHFGNAYIEWDTAAIEYAICENEKHGGRFYKYSINGEAGVLYCIPTGDSMVVKDFAGSTAQLYSIAAELNKLYHKDNYLFRLADSSAMGEAMPFAMTHWIKKETDSLSTIRPFYLSLALD